MLKFLVLLLVASLLLCKIGCGFPGANAVSTVTTETVAPSTDAVSTVTTETVAPSTVLETTTVTETTTEEEIVSPQPVTPSIIDVGINSMNVTLSISSEDENAESVEGYILEYTKKDLYPDDTLNLTKTTKSDECNETLCAFTLSDLVSGETYHIWGHTFIENTISLASDMANGTTVPPTPSISVTATGTTTMDVTLNVTSGNAISAYEYVCEDQDTNLTISDTADYDSDSHTFSPTLLTPGTVYTCWGFTYSANGEQKSDPSQQESDATEPDVPNNLDVSNIDEDNLTVFWTEPEGNFVGFYIECLSDGDHTDRNGTVEKHDDDEKDYSFTCEFLTSGANYTVYVTSLWKKDGYDDQMSEPVTKEATTIPPQPTLSTSEVDLKSMKVSFSITTTDFAVSGCKLHYNDNIKETQNVREDVQDICSFLVEDLIPGTQYTLWGYTLSGQVPSQKSDNITEATLLDEPDYIILEPGTDDILVTWTQPEGGHTGFEVTCTGNDPLAENYFVESIDYSERCTGLTAGVEYTVTVVTVEDDLSLTSDGVTNYTITIPEQPTIESTLAVNTTQIYVNFSYEYDESVAQCTHYNISWSPDDDSELVPCTSTEYSITELMCNTRYVVNVSAVTNPTNTEWQDLDPAVGQPDTKDDWTLPEKVDHLGIASILSRSFVVEWNPAASCSPDDMWYELKVTPGENGESCLHYTLYENTVETCTEACDSRTDEEAPAECEAQCTCYDEENGSLQFNVTGLKPYTDHEVEMTAVNLGGRGETAELTGGVQTSEDVPGPVKELEERVGADNITLTWTEPDEPNGIIKHYTVCYNLTTDHHDQDYNDTDGLTTGCDDTQDTSWSEDGFYPSATYSFCVKACTDPGCGNNTCLVATMGDAFPPQPVIVKAYSTSSHSIHVLWEQGGTQKGDTNYTAVATDDGDTFQCETIGYTETECEIYHDDMIPYRTYSVDVTASTSVGDTKSAPESVQLISDKPGKVTSVKLTSKEQDKECYHMYVEWEPLDDKLWHGEPNGYVVKLKGDNDDIHERTFLPNEASGYIDVNPNNWNYEVEIAAKNDQNGTGDITTGNTESSGVCSPIFPEDDGQYVTLEATITCDDHDACHDNKKQFVVQLDKAFLCDEANGDISDRGVIVAEYKDNSISGVDDITIAEELDNMDEYRTWAQAIDTKPIPPYRATEINWPVSGNQSFCSSVAKRAVEIYEEVIGRSQDCENTAGDEYCNGYVKSGRDYKIRAFTCTKGGCILTAYSEWVYVIQSGTDVGAIVGGVLGALAFLAIIAAILFLLYRYEKWPFTICDSDGSDGTRTQKQSFHEMDNIKKSNVILVDDFEHHVKDMHRDSDLKFSDEYKDIKDGSPQHPTEASELQQNRPKNRYVNILPFDQSRVKLLPQDGEEGSDYINANYMVGYSSKREFIAAQGPLPSTVDDFWRMLWEQNVPMIVMLTRLSEKGREKCSQYWPQDREPVYYGDLQVRMTSESQLDNYVIRVLDVALGESVRTITQFHYTTWPDFGCPDNTTVLLNFVLEVRRQIRPIKHVNGPVLVHCRYVSDPTSSKFEQLS